MSGPSTPPTPPEVPEEFADVYRQAYEKAYEEALSERAQAEAVDAAGDAEADPGDDLEQEDAEQEEATATAQQAAVPADHPEEPPPAEPGPEESARPRGGAHADWSAAERAEPEDLGVGPVAPPGGTWTEYSTESGWDRYRGSRWFVPSLLLISALLLVVAAYGVGRVFATGVDQVEPTASSTADATVPASDPDEKAPGSGRPGQHPSQSAGQKAGDKGKHAKRPHTAWHGRVSPVAVGAASAGCVDRPGVDAAGHTVTYQPANAIDGRSSTAWRCPGRAIGKRLVLRLPRQVAVGAVGLIPGYAKTDPVSGADRYAQNNRITKLRWSLGHGTTVVQHLGGSARDRSMRTVRVPRTRTDRIVLQVLAVRKGPRNTTCVSEVRIGRAG